MLSYYYCLQLFCGTGQSRLLLVIKLNEQTGTTLRPLESCKQVAQRRSFCSDLLSSNGCYPKGWQHRSHGLSQDGGGILRTMLNAGSRLSFQDQLAKLAKGLKFVTCWASIITWLVYPRRSVSFALCLICKRE